MIKKRVAVLASGSGSNFQVLIDHSKQEGAAYEIIALIVNIPSAFALNRAESAGIKAITIDHKAFDSRASFENELHQELLNLSPDIIVCAGFMRILQPDFVLKWDGKMINIHPSLLPKYKGLHTHQRAIDAEDKQAGCTVHFVNAGVDEGAIIGQASVEIDLHDNADSLAAKVLVKEHKLFPICLDALAREQVWLENGSAKFKVGGILTA